MKSDVQLYKAASNARFEIAMFLSACSGKGGGEDESAEM